jgi:2-amino-4-hydroxy-6-hydroxymethyldihydropteridine diphosphokinase
VSVIAYVGLGSNLGDPQRQVCEALRALRRIRDTAVESVSSLYRSPPMGPPDQPDYINAVASLATGLTPLELLDALQAIEQHHGRTRVGERWGPRTLDLDLLLYGDGRVSDPRLQVPHPGLHERAFVLYPLREIAPGELVIPDRGQLDQLIEGCPGGVPERLNKCDER